MKGTGILMAKSLIYEFWSWKWCPMSGNMTPNQTTQLRKIIEMSKHYCSLNLVLYFVLHLQDYSKHWRSPFNSVRLTNDLYQKSNALIETIPEGLIGGWSNERGGDVDSGEGASSCMYRPTYVHHALTRRASFNHRRIIIFFGEPLTSQTTRCSNHRRRRRYDDALVYLIGKKGESWKKPDFMDGTA